MSKLPDSAIKLIQRYRDIAALYANPYTIQIRDKVDQHWESFCYDAPLTLQQAEDRVKEHQQENPKATFRVVPWLNLSQEQFIRFELKAESALPPSAKSLFHALWGKAVGTPDYDKEQWLQLENVLTNA